MMKLRIAILAVMMLLAGGCARNEPPTHDWTDHAAALRTMNQRDAELRTLSARCLLTLENPQGTVRLESALAMERPRRLRLRAWKFSQAIFDLTMNEQGIHALAPEQGPRADSGQMARASAAQIARAWGVFMGDLLIAENLMVQDGGGATFTVRSAIDDELTVLCTIDRRTLTAQRYDLLDAQGTVRFTLRLERYRRFGDVVFPTRLAGQGPTGSFIADLSDVETNTPHPPRTFEPPARAERLQ